jgi:hypothetical protein
VIGLLRCGGISPQVLDTDKVFSPVQRNFQEKKSLWRYSD